MEDEIKIEPISALQKALEETPEWWVKLENWVNPFENDVKMKLSPFQETILASAYINGALPDRSWKRGGCNIRFHIWPNNTSYWCHTNQVERLTIPIWMPCKLLVDQKAVVEWNRQYRLSTFL